MFRKWFVINVLFFSLPNFVNHPKRKKNLANMKMKEIFLKNWLSTTTYHKKVTICFPITLHNKPSLHMAFE